jgi:ferric-dicitrate binding protein FerR (iron transport regulator)
MKKHFERVIASAVVVMGFAMMAFAQSETISSALGDKYIISAKAGGVNFIDGSATISRNDGRTGILLKGDSVEIGERVSTTAGSKAEILLNPGSYLRVGGSTSFEFESTSLDDLRIRLVDGIAMLEVFADDEFVVRVNAPGASYDLVDTGIYRVETANGISSIYVWKGRAEIVSESDTKVKSGRRAVVAGDNVAIAKFDKGDRDELAEWSKDRSKQLAKITQSLKPRNVRDPLISAFNSNLWNFHNSFGLWVFDPFRGSYCFLPFGRGWSTPYGYWYGYDIWSYRLPWYVYYPPTGGGTRTPTTQNPTTTSGPINDRRRVPPFQRVEGGSSVRRTTTEPSDPFPSVQTRRRISAPRAPISVSPNPAKRP